MIGRPRIKYNDIVVDLREGWNSFINPEEHTRVDLKAMSKVEEFLSYATQRKITASRNLISSQTKTELDRFFAYVKDGSTCEFWRDYNLCCYLPFENTVNTIDEETGTFTRSDSGNTSVFLNPDSGLLENPGTGLPRYPSGKYGKGLIIENAGNNLIGSDWIDFSNWTPSNVTVTDNTTETKDPFGNNYAAKLVSTSSYAYIEYTTSTAVGNYAVFSIYLKAPTGSVNAYLSIQGSSGGTSGSIIPVIPYNENDNLNGFTRYQFATNTSGFGGYLKPRLYIVSTGQTIYAYGGMIEDNKKYAGSVSSVNVPADSCVYTPSTDWLQSKTFTIAFWFMPLWDYDELSTSAFLFSSGISGGIDHVIIRVDTNGNLRLQAKRDNGSTSAIDVTYSTSIVKNTFYHVVATIDSTIANGGKLYLDGSLVATSSNYAFNISDTATQFAIGSKVNGTEYTSDTIFDEVMVYRDIKDATWVNQLYNRGRGEGLGKNYYSSVILESYTANERKNNFYDVELSFKEEIT